MTVFQFKARRDKLRTWVGRWQPAETAELMRLYAVLAERRGARGYEYGETESNEPQFYILGPRQAPECVACVSRVLQSDHPLYLIEDGAGRVCLEGDRLKRLVQQFIKRLRNRYLLMVTPIFGLLSKTWEKVLEQEAFAADFIMCIT